MEEQKKLVVLNEDDRAIALKGLKDLSFSAHQMHELLSQGKLTEEAKALFISLSERYVSDVAKATNYESDLAKERERRSADLRNANLRIRELKQQMAEMKPIDGLKEQLHSLTNTIKDWWRELGFNYISEMTFTDYGGLNVKFAFNLNRCSRIFSRKPVSDKKEAVDKIQQLCDKGFVLIKEGNELQLADNDENKKLLINLLEERFPSIQIERIEASFERDNQVSYIESVKAYIGELHEI
ncbi:MULTISPECIES: hypothetical protein [Bacillus cereus group]|uniref:Uncharacterized protein n=1 Tax=Bacillus cereus TaxID=1396 RepID=A0A9X6VVJ7_BACCE|nr:MULTISPECIES: hypothetical protein [Bacillus cereus group]PES55593.1 hypothetical protein CN515_06185 [Bacillus cereus]PFA29395.1 hypothetical protein CN384_06750 [Bacillus thuringiensis]PFF46173.1 hypothetical protein CN357_22270 [Bacillus cereus]PFQ24107.1 hypothetical protein COK33_33735 [Bacillus cereus]PGB15629.1 hypothetical protein COM09_08405 [Bacillus toyonensis]